MDAQSRQRWLAQFLDWAGSQPDLRAVLLVGSGSRGDDLADHPADEWSDFDLLLIATDPRPYLAATGWLAQFGDPLFSIVERDPAGEPWERRVLYASGLDVDFIVLAPGEARQNFSARPVIGEILGRGRRVLLDKDGLLAGLAAKPLAPPVAQPPSQEAFEAVVQDFWFHAAWTTKKLRRGELWAAVTCHNTYLKRLLLQMIEWHAQAVYGLERDVWFDGRFIESWAAPEVLQALPAVFAHYAAADVARSLQASMRLFHHIASQTAHRWQRAYPAENAEQVLAWVEGTIHE